MSRGELGAATAAAFLLVLLFQSVLAFSYARSDPYYETLVADALSYDRQAARIAEHGLAGEPVFHQAPLYPWLLARLYRLVPEEGRRGWALAAQCVSNAAAIALLLPAGALAFGRRAAGIWAVLLALGFAPVPFYGLKLLPGSLALATQAGALVALMLARRRAGLLAPAAAGAAAGVAALCRAEMLLFVAAAALWVAGGFLPRARRAAAFVCGALLAVAPATAHNVRAGDVVVVASSAGENLFAGNRRGARGGHSPIDPRAGDLFTQRLAAESLAERAAGRELKPSEISAYWSARAREEIFRDPAGWITLVGRKLGRLVDPGDPTDLYPLALERRHYLPALRWLPWSTLSLWLLAGLSLARRETPRVLLLLPTVHLVVLAVFFVDSRLRVPFYFHLALLGAGAAVRLTSSGFAPRALLAATVLLGIAASGPSDRDRVRTASVLSLQSRLPAALEMLAPSLRRRDPDPVALDQAGWVLQKMGRLADARDHYRRALDAGLPSEREGSTRGRLAHVERLIGEGP